MQNNYLGGVNKWRVMFGAGMLNVVIMIPACGGGGGGDSGVTEPPSALVIEPPPSTPAIDPPSPAVVVAAAADIVVAADTPTEIRNDQHCSLIEAIVNANNDDATYSDCMAGTGDDVIVLPDSSNQVLTAVNNSTYGPTGLPVIISTITIKGNGSTIVRESNAPSFRIFAVAKKAELHLNDTIIRGGASVQYGDVSNNGGVGFGSPSQGGGVLNYGTLVVDNSKISGNTSARGGGGIHSEGGTLVVRDSVLSDNVADGPGGAINQVRNFGTLLNNECIGNIAQLDGGCMWAGATSNVTVTKNTIQDNSGKAGGGLRAEWNTVLVVKDSAVSENYASGRGGGVSVGAHATALILNSTIDGNVSDVHGGGVLSSGSLTLVKNSTISGNLAPRGAGILTGTSGTLGGTTMVMSSTITLNQASEEGGGILNLSPGPIFLSHVLISGNSAAVQPSELGDSTGTAIANGFNLFGHDGDAGVVGLTPGTKDIVGAVSLNAILETGLRDNGGPTRTHALIAGSPAIDAGDPKYSTLEVGGEWMYDQRGPGFRRFDADSGIVDIGAFEAQ